MRNFSANYAIMHLRNLSWTLKAYQFSLPNLRCAFRIFFYCANQYCGTLCFLSALYLRFNFCLNEQFVLYLLKSKSLKVAPLGQIF